MTLRHEPVALILSRQALPTLDRQRFGAASGVASGAYVLADAADGKPEVILIATGSEVALCVAARERLTAEGLKARVVSMPSWELFERQDQSLPRQRLAAVGHRARRRRAGVHLRLGALRGVRRGSHRHEDLRRVGAAQGAAEEVRLHPRERGGAARASRAAAALERRADETNPLAAPGGPHGQSVWLDYIRRSLITSGELAAAARRGRAARRDVEPGDLREGDRGLDATTRPISQALAGAHGSRRQDALRAPRDRGHPGRGRRAAPALSTRRSGATATSAWKSRPTSPTTPQGTLAEARRLWKAVDRENVMIKVPATPTGIPAIQQLISEGINVNVTLLFAQEAYEQVAEAYISRAGRGLRQARGRPRPRRQRGQLLHQPHRLADRRDAGGAAQGARRRHGAARCSRASSARSRSPTPSSPTSATRSSSRRRAGSALAARGAQTQRLLWASTSTKNPLYRDVIYVEELIGPDTVNTIPPGHLRRLPRSRPRAPEPRGESRGGARHDGDARARSASRCGGDR